VPDFPIVDSHVHLYDIDRLRYDWLKSVPAIHRTNLLSEFDAARGPVQVDKIVFVEVAVASGLHLEEASLVQELVTLSNGLRAWSFMCRSRRGWTSSVVS
jgi:L-fuconolactonase